MDKAILLAAARRVHGRGPGVPAQEARSTQTAGFAARLIVRLARRPGWLPGIA